MAVGYNLLVSGCQGWGNYSDKSITVTLTANTLIAVMIDGTDFNNSGSLGAGASCSDTKSLTWTRNIAEYTTDKYTHRLSMWSAQTGSESGTDTITVDFDRNLGNVVWWVFEFTGYDTTTPIGTVAGAIQQNGDGPETLVLPASPALDSLVIAWMSVDMDYVSGSDYPNVDPGSGWTEIEDTWDEAVYVTYGQCQYRTNSTSVSVAWADVNATDNTVIYESALGAFEVRAAASGPSISIPVIMNQLRQQGIS